MRYPLTIRFKLLALASQVAVSDADGAELFYVKQKLFKLKEKIEIYHDHSKSQLLYTINADKIIDWSPTYTLRSADGAELGSIKRQGRASLWKATYDLVIGGQPAAQVKETNPWVKFIDGLCSELPIIGLFTGYLFHPKYSVTGTDGTELALLAKHPAFFEGRFGLEDKAMSALDEANQNILAVLLMMVVLMERTRG